MFTHRLLFPILYFFVVLIVLPIFTSDKVYSMFYQEDVAKNAEIDQMKLEFRKKGVEKYLKSIDERATLAYHEDKLSEPVDNLIIIFARKPKHDDLLLSQLAAEVDRNIRKERFYRSAFFVCNVTRINFSELELLSGIYPVRQAKNTTSWKLFNREEVIKHDFVECITHALAETEAKHLTLIRDHVVPYSGFLQVLNRVIATRLNNTISRGELQQADSSWLFLHLQEPVPFRHYEFSLSCVYELFVISSIGGLLFFLVLWWVEDPRHQHLMSVRVTYIFYGILYFFTFALIIGRPYVSELRRFAPDFYRLYDPPEPVHFSAMSLPAASAAELVKHLNEVRCSVYVPFHRVLDHMVNTIELPGYVISPSLVKYVART
ncbi:uncharacterized protein LOC122259046 [Penaeus japonicus]|uniref:uncharacterized protein LOC122250494 n=1 Tax=Penaeus japonicus TaxID=27405 RepID=UPI001C711C8F|nr:uncharacterized protein LOC122250494 [Penaeus japonicus]XP_042867863.1 uncharacterized protein LOC122250494 [Penaeus japonicus]XP_042881452.1 uncharacterized protein LOC122259046 [Penaeus japonicus]XP_042881453.1 uncharacterized protein LOC122259046 [Penaeus japonicus]